MAKDPTIYLSHWTNETSGEHLWQVTDHGMPLCASTPDRDRAQRVYDDRRQANMRWNSSERQYESHIPEVAPVWNGDLGAFEVAS